MQYLMSRYGGSLITIGKGKTSNDKLPEDQSLDNMLDNYAVEIIPNHFYISSYDAKPEWMGGMHKLYFPNTIKIGTIEHRFNEVFFQHDVTAVTDIYIGFHQWNNVYAVLLKTHKESIEYLFEEYEERYDYVLQVFIRSKVEGYDQSLSKNSAYVEKILLLLFYKMGLIYEGDIIDFIPSKTHLGKKIAKTFTETITKRLIGVESDEDMSKILMEYES
jgi:hypothetical protein